MIEHRRHPLARRSTRRWWRRCARATSSWSCWPASCASSRRASWRRSPTAWSTSTPRCCRLSRACNSQAQAFRHGVKIAGCTVHLVDAGVDSGPILAQAAVLVLDDDDEDRLRLRILAEEHKLLPAVVRAIAEGRVDAGSRPASRAARPARAWVSSGLPPANLSRTAVAAVAASAALDLRRPAGELVEWARHLAAARRLERLRAASSPRLRRVGAASLRRPPPGLRGSSQTGAGPVTIPRRWTRTSTT